MRRSCWYLLEVYTLSLADRIEWINAQQHRIGNPNNMKIII